METTAPGPDSRTTFVGGTRPSQPGVYVSRKRQVIETELVEATISIESITTWLGLPAAGSLKIVDANGREITGPITIKIEGEADVREEAIP